MQKEAFIAIFIGLFLGLTTTASIYYIKTKNQQNKIIKSEKEILQPSPSPSPVANHQLKLYTPLDGVISSNPKIKITGSFQSGGYLISSLNEQNTITNLDAETFDLTVKVKPGPNMIYLVGLDNDGNADEQSRLVVYQPLTNTPESTSAAKLDSTSESAQERISSNSGENTATAAAILARINKKLGKDQANNNQNRAILGQVKKVTTESITITNDQGNFILPLNDATLLKEDKPIEIDDVAVDSWALVVGQISAVKPDVDLITPAVKFKPKTIQIYQKKPIADKPVVILGNIDQVKGRTLTVSDRKTNTQHTVVLDKNTTIDDTEGQSVKLSQLEKDLSLIVVARQDKQNQLVAQKILLLGTVSHEEK